MLFDGASVGRNRYTKEVIITKADPKGVVAVFVRLGEDDSVQSLYRAPTLLDKWM